jgi:hypothetical protein
MKARLVEQHAETGEERALPDWFAAQALGSLDTLEAAARTILGLVTGLLGLLLGVLSLSEDPLPSYLWNSPVRALGIGAVVALLAALGSALVVLLPRRLAVSSHRPDLQARAFEAMLARKACWLTATVIAFGGGLLLLGAILIVALLTAV